MFQWPLKRLMIFSWLASKRRKREDLQRMHYMRVAVNADKKQFDKLTRILEHG